MANLLRLINLRLLSALVGLALVATFGLYGGGEVTKAQEEQLMQGKIFLSLKSRQKEVVDLWLKARDESGSKRQNLEEKAKRYQDELAKEVAKFKAMSKNSLEILKENYEQQQKKVSPQLSKEERDAIELQIKLKKNMLRYNNYILEGLKLEYKKELRRRREELDKNQKELLHIHEQWLDRVKELEKEIEDFEVRKKYAVQLQHESHQDMVKEAKLHENETRLAELEDLSHYTHLEESYWIERISSTKKELQRVQELGGNKNYRPHVMGYSEKEWKKGFIDPIKSSVRELEKDYRDLSWGGIGGYVLETEQLKREIATLQTKIGGKDANMQRMAKEQAYLERIIAYEFVVEVPDPKGFIDNLYDAIQTLDDVLSSVEEIKDIYNIIQSGNPRKILDMACEKAYGQNFAELFVDKLGLQEYMDNKWVKLAVKGKFDKDKVWQELANKGLPPEVYNKLETLDKMRRNPQGFAGDMFSSHIEGLVGSNPYLKDIVADTRKIQRYARDPDAIKDDMQQYFKEQLSEVAIDSKLYNDLQAQYQSYHKKVDDFIAIKKKSEDDFKLLMADGIDYQRKKAMISNFSNRLPQKDEAYWKSFVDRVHKSAGDIKKDN